MDALIRLALSRGGSIHNAELEAVDISDITPSEEFLQKQNAALACPVGGACGGIGHHSDRLCSAASAKSGRGYNY